MKNNIYYEFHSQDDISTQDLPSGESVYNYLTSRLNLSIHKSVSMQSVENSLLYLFEHMRCGVFVMIRNNDVVIFCPFVNRDYTNTWGDALNLSRESLEQYYSDKKEVYREENYISDKNKWWANGNIICNEHTRAGTPENQSQWWGDTFLMTLKDMLLETCQHRKVITK